MSCPPGFEPEGSKVIKCLGNNRWNASNVPNCKPIATKNTTLPFQAQTNFPTWATSVVIISGLLTSVTSAALIFLFYNLKQEIAITKAVQATSNVRAKINEFHNRGIDRGICSF